MMEATAAKFWATAADDDDASFGVSPIKGAAPTAKPAAAAEAVKPPEPEPEPGAEPESKKGEVFASASPKRAVETAPESPKSFDWLVRKLGSGNDVDQAQAFMKMDPTEQMEILMRVDLLNGDMFAFVCAIVLYKNSKLGTRSESATFPRAIYS